MTYQLTDGSTTATFDVVKEIQPSYKRKTKSFDLGIYNIHDMGKSDDSVKAVFIVNGSDASTEIANLRTLRASGSTVTVSGFTLDDYFNDDYIIENASCKRVADGLWRAEVTLKRTSTS